MRVLEKITVENFRSIRHQSLPLGQLNVFIGGNGSGKSNLVQAFRLMREVAQQNLANFSLERGADSLLRSWSFFWSLAKETSATGTE